MVITSTTRKDIRTAEAKDGHEPPEDRLCRYFNKTIGDYPADNVALEAAGGLEGFDRDSPAYTDVSAHAPLSVLPAVSS